MRLILASGSPYRHTLLDRLRLPFTAVAPAVDETPSPGESPQALAERLALAKARAVAKQHAGAIVIGSDQVASLHGTALGKPGGFERAREQLLASRGQCLTFYTALCVVGPDGECLRHLEPFKVHFRALDAVEIDRYLGLEQPWDCAGSFKWEGLGISLFERLEGDDPTALEGLPLIALCRILGKLGVHPLG